MLCVFLFYVFGNETNMSDDIVCKKESSLLSFVGMKFVSFISSLESSK